MIKLDKPKPVDRPYYDYYECSKYMRHKYPNLDHSIHGLLGDDHRLNHYVLIELNNENDGTSSPLREWLDEFGTADAVDPAYRYMMLYVDW